MLKQLAISAALAAAVSASPAAATEIFNETFEGISGNNFIVQGTAGVWTAEPGTPGIELQFGNTGGAPAPNGGRVKVELDSTGNSGMFYTLTSDGNFLFEFLFSPRPNVGPNSNIIQVLLDDVVLDTFTGGSNPTTVWSTQSVRFSGFAGNKLIVRADGRSDTFGGYVDNTRLELTGAIPEPGTWMLMILGLGAVGFAMRRRQSASVKLQFA